MASQQIGNSWFSLTDLLAVEKRTGLAGYFQPGFNVYLRGGVKLRLTDAEKTQLDEALALHQKTMQVMAIVKELQGQTRR